MPTYQYRCTECDNELEVVQKFSDPSLTVCPECEGALRKVFNAVGVVFKGSGFYRTDSRSAENQSGGGSRKSESDGSGKASADSGSTSDSGAKSDSASTSEGASTSDGGSKNGSSEKKTPATSGSSSTGSKAANN